MPTDLRNSPCQQVLKNEIRKVYDSLTNHHYIFLLVLELLIQSKLSTIAYKLLYVKNFKICKISAWINHIHKILNDSGMSYIWTLQNCISEKWLKLVIKNNLIDQFKQIWNSSIEISSKGGNYKLFKGD